MELSNADWNLLLEKISERKTVLVIGDNLTRIHNNSLVEYISSHLLEHVRNYYAQKWGKEGFPKKIIEQRIKKEITLPTNSSIMDMNWWEYSEAFEATSSGNLVQFIKDLIDDIREEDLDYSLVDDLLSIGKFNIILSTSYSKTYKELVEEWAKNNKCRFYYADIQKERLIITPDEDGGTWYGENNQVLFINLMGNISPSTRSLNHILVTEEDIILFVCSWIKSLSQRVNLIDHLKDNFLLVLGCHAPSWAFRFIWYILKNPTAYKLSQESSQSLCLRPSPLDNSVSKFILRYATKIVNAEDTASFIEKLKNKWIANGYNVEIKDECPPPDSVDVFISYASEDRATVEHFIIPIMESLAQTENITYWYDQENLRPGNVWEKEIEHAIKHTCVFLALQTPLSKKICRDNKVKYLKYEWGCAINRNIKINNYDKDLEGRFNIILPIIYGSGKECLFHYFEDFQFLSINDTNFEEKLKETIKIMIETNRQYIEP